MGAYGDIPPDLPALWAALGHRDQAESLLPFVPPYTRVRAAASHAALVGAAGEPDRAERLVRDISVRDEEIREPYEKSSAWSDLAWQAVLAGDRERSGRLVRESYAQARSVTAPYLQSQLLLGWARVRAAGGDRPKAAEFADRAQALAEGLNEPSWSQWVLAALPVIVTGPGDLHRAATLVGTVPDPYHRARAAAELAVMLAARGEHDRAEALLAGVSDEYRRARLSDALNAVRAVDPHPGAAPYQEARALASLAAVIAAGGSGHAWGVSDWAEPLVRYSTSRDDQARVLAALAAGASGGDSDRGAALADRAEAIVRPVQDPEAQPQALVTLAWMVADAGDPPRAAKLASAAQALVRHSGHRRPGWRVADLARLAKPVADGSHVRYLPELTGTPKQREWADDLRLTYVSGRWGMRLTAEAHALLAPLTDAHWWISNRDDLDGALAAKAGIRKPAGPGAPSRMSDLPEITGAPRQRMEATEIRRKLVRFRWGNEIPPGVREVLDRLTDADWWIENEVGDGHPMAIDRAVGAQLPEHYRKKMALPSYGSPPELHPGPCEEQPEYARSRQVASERAAETGDIRIGRKGESALPAPDAPCCRTKGFSWGERDGKEVWLNRRAAEIGQADPRISRAEARKRAGSDLGKIERNLDGWG